MKILMLATDSDSTWMLYNKLSYEFTDIEVIIEQSVPTKVFLKRRVAKHGYFVVFGQVLFIVAMKFLRGRSRERITEILQNNQLSVNRPASVKEISVESVNSADCIAAVERSRPDIVVINGTRILGKKLLAAIKVPIVNTHCGITPHYRGVHGAYWALYNSDQEHAGVTVHMVDAGVDTGGIIYQKTIQLSKQDNFVTYPYLQYASGMPLMIQALKDFEQGKLKSFERTDLPSRQWEHPTMWQYVYARLCRGIR